MRKLLGYRLKEEKYREAAKNITGSSLEGWDYKGIKYDFLKGSNACKSIAKAGVMHWFEEVYEEEQLEEWLPVVNYEGFYEVSNKGNVRSVDRLVKHSRWEGATRTVNGRELVLTENNDGYYKVNLSKEGDKNTHLVHHLVAEAFLDHTKRSHYICVDHIDEDVKNNQLDNLQIISKKENTKKSFEVAEEKRKLIEDTWYKYGSAIFNYQSEKSCYGWRQGEWLDSNWEWFRTIGVEPATTEEIQQALIKEAKKRGLWYKAKIKEHADNYNWCQGINNGNFSALYNSYSNTLYNKNGVIFHNGKWAEILPTESLNGKTAIIDGVEYELKIK